MIPGDDLLLLQKIWNYMCIESDLPESADVIVVGGAGLMEDGALRAAELYHQGVAPRIIVSGFANQWHNATRTEAELLRDRLLQCDVPETAIIVEDQASNTGENVIFSAAILSKMNLSIVKVILVHKPFMTRRFLATAQAQWPMPQPELFVTSQPTTLEEYLIENKETYGDSSRMVTLMLGDYERIKSYPSRGFSTPQPISPDAERAFEELQKRGYTTKEMK